MGLIEQIFAVARKYGQLANDDSKWITIGARKKNKSDPKDMGAKGRKVLIDSDTGKILGGAVPKQFHGKNIKNAFKETAVSSTKIENQVGTEAVVSKPIKPSKSYKNPKEKKLDEKYKKLLEKHKKDLEKLDKKIEKAKKSGDPDLKHLENERESLRIYTEREKIQPLKVKIDIEKNAAEKLLSSYENKITFKENTAGRELSSIRDKALKEVSLSEDSVKDAGSVYEKEFFTDDVVAEGQERLKKEVTYKKELDSLFKIFGGNRQDVGKEDRNEAFNKWLELRALRDKFCNEQNERFIRLNAAKISKIREIYNGKVSDVFHEYPKELEAKLEVALKYFPKEWVEKLANQKHKVHVTIEKQEKHVAGSYAASFKRLSVGKDTGTYVLIHELCHAFEDVMPEIVSLEKEFYDRRTEGKKLMSLKTLSKGAYSASSKCRDGNFIDPYIGRDYRRKRGLFYGCMMEERAPTAYEVLSMGVEFLATSPEALSKDPDYKKFILGMLALI